jgi:RNA polymerase sigma-70 factor (ECF subfamily)
MVAAAPDSALCNPADRFRAIYVAELDYVWNSLRRLGVPRRDLEDLAHDVFAAAYRSLSSYDASRPLRPWLFGIAFRVASQVRRDRDRAHLDLAEAGEIAGRGPGPEDAAMASEERKLVLDALGKLELDRRAVFVMHELNGHAMPEIAEALSIPLNTAYSRLRLARRDFAEAVQTLSAREKTSR